MTMPLFLLLAIPLWVWIWRFQAPKVLRAHSMALDQMIAEGDFDIGESGGSIHVRMADCIVKPAAWARAIFPFRGIPIRQQHIIWRDSETGVITELCLQTTMKMKPGICVLSSTKAVSGELSRLVS